MPPFSPEKIHKIEHMSAGDLNIEANGAVQRRDIDQIRELVKISFVRHCATIGDDPNEGGSFGQIYLGLEQVLASEADRRR